MEIILAKSAGFCFGVDRAVRIALESESEDSPCTLGPIIHNAHVADRLREKGIRQLSGVDEAERGSTVIICSHGAPKEIYDILDEKGVRYIDATCPYVKRIHRIVQKAGEEGRTVVIVGDRRHTEVIGISGWCGDCLVVETPEELSGVVEKLKDRPVTLVSQTTLDMQLWEECAEIIKRECTNPEIFDTICSATIMRQNETAELAKECDAMIVIGDKKSANTNRLVLISRRYTPHVKHVESADEIDPKEYIKFSKVGITAGASTPSWIIEEVCRKMSEEVKNTEIREETEVGTESFAELLEQSLKTLSGGEKVTGIVTGVSETEVFVDLGTKHAGYIPMSELTDSPSAKPEDIVKVGDEIEVYVMRVNDMEGTVMLSKKRVDSVKGWQEVEAAMENKEVVEGYVLEENKGGIVVLVKGVRVFVPSSQTGIPKGSPLTPLVRTKVRLRITEVNHARRRIVGSIRLVQSEERREKAAKVWAEIEEGKTYRGVVKSLTSYGAFVDIGGVDGMIHVSELSWQRVRHPSDVLKVGQEVEVHVLSFDRDKKRISLGLRKPEENPWNIFMANYKVGDVIKAKVVKLMPFGAFAEIIPGVDGLVHISQISDRRIGKPGDVLSENQEIDCVITNIDNEEQKVWLSIRALLESAAPKAEEADDASQPDRVVAVSEEGKLEVAPDVADEVSAESKQENEGQSVQAEVSDENTVSEEANTEGEQSAQDDAPAES
ncbi:MAG: bifunctional 4-hydroxy-3-methylbut-2-enyl diphosphate reductase/30S ribosomal protein S1 [Clostridiales bacterium]|nr:bifunctional 4-hydroxy-3-methylbut-2-enyl diphosphate reductase/30S ribosomal protein S1 [Clostridiales bacterium]